MSAMSDGARDVDFSLTNGNIFAASFDNGAVQLWDSSMPRACFEKFSAHKRTTLSVNWHPHEVNKLATGGGDSLVKVWDVSDTAKPVGKV